MPGRLYSWLPYQTPTITGHGQPVALQTFIRSMRGFRRSRRRRHHRRHHRRFPRCCRPQQMIIAPRQRQHRRERLCGRRRRLRFGRQILRNCFPISRNTSRKQHGLRHPLKGSLPGSWRTKVACLACQSGRTTHRASAEEIERRRTRPGFRHGDGPMPRVPM